MKLEEKITKKCLDENHKGLPRRIPGRTSGITPTRTYGSVFEIIALGRIFNGTSYRSSDETPGNVPGENFR